MFFQYKSSNEFALLTTQKVFDKVILQAKDQINLYDIESRNFINLTQTIKNIDKLPEKSKKHNLLPIVTQHIKDSNYVYAVYVGYKNDTFYEIINLNLSKNMHQLLKIDKKARWLIFKHIKENNIIVKYTVPLDKDLNILSKTKTQTNYRPTQRPWYKQAIKTSKVIKTKPYIFSVLKQPGVTYAKVINKESGTILALDISLNSLNKLLASQSFVKGSISFVFEEDGTLIGQYDDIVKKSYKNIDEQYKDIFIKNGQVLDLNKQKIIEINGKKYLKYTTKLKSIFKQKDYLTIVSPIDIIMKPYNEKIYESLIITLLILIFIVSPIIMYAVRLIVKPILELETENKKIGQGKFKDVIPVNSFMIEISNLSNSLVDMSSSINDLTNNLEEKIKDRTIEVEQKSQNITNLLDNAGQGFLSFGRDMIVHEEISKETLSIFEMNIVGKNIIELLYPNDKQRQDFITSSMHDILDEDESMSEVMMSLLKKEFLINDKYIEFKYKVLHNNTFMLVLTDITSKKKLDQKIQDEQQTLKMVVETVTSIEQFTEVKNDYESMIDKIDLLKKIENLPNLRKEIHTYKGLFAQKNMLNIVKELHNFESLIDISLKDNNLDKAIENITKSKMQEWLDKDIEVLKNILGNDYFNKSNKICIKKIRIDEISNDLCILRDEIKEYLIKYISKPQLSVTFKDTLFKINSLKYHNIDIFLNPYILLVDQLAMKLEKPVNELIINKEEDIYLSDNYKPFLNSLVHIFRNSVDHGIETVERREELDKELFGTIICDINKDKNNIYIKISDDGQGIDKEKIKSLAIQKEIYTDIEIENLNDQEILKIIFLDAFSTIEKVTEISGRGVGLASILFELNKIGGNMLIENKFGKGIKFIFAIPIDK